MRVVTVIIGMILLTSILITSPASAQQKKMTVAVLEFQRTGALDAGEAATLTNRFRGLLVQTETFEVVEREKMKEILKEQDFTMTDQCNSAECAVQIGQLLGVQAMIAGDIGKVGQTYTLDLRMVDVSTGKIIKTHNEDYKGEIDGLLAIMKKASEKFAEAEKTRLADKAKADKTKIDDKDKIVDKGKETKTDKGKTDKGTTDKGTTGGGTQVVKKGFSMKWVYIGAGVVAAGGAAAVLLGGKKGGGGANGIDPPFWPTDTGKK